MSNFTPGPWVSSFVNADFEGNHTEGWQVNGPGEDEWICDCGLGGNAEDCARLISLAPEMLEALKDAQESIRKLLNSQRPDLIPQLDPQGWGTLIAKAEGNPNPTPPATPNYGICSVCRRDQIGRRHTHVCE